MKTVKVFEKCGSNQIHCKGVKWLIIVLSYNHSSHSNSHTHTHTHTPSWAHVSFLTPDESNHKLENSCKYFRKSFLVDFFFFQFIHKPDFIKCSCATNIFSHDPIIPGKNFIPYLLVLRSKSEKTYIFSFFQIWPIEAHRSWMIQKALFIVTNMIKTQSWLHLGQSNYKRLDGGTALNLPWHQGLYRRDKIQIRNNP